MAYRKVYLQPDKMVYNALLDIMELQKGVENINDYMHGKLHFTITMYGYAWAVMFAINKIGYSRCAVTLEIAGADEAYKEEDNQFRNDMMRREFALLDAMLLMGEPNEIVFSDS